MLDLDQTDGYQDEHTISLVEFEIVLLESASVDAVRIPQVCESGNKRSGNRCKAGEEGSPNGNHQGYSQQDPKSCKGEECLQHGDGLVCSTKYLQTKDGVGPWSYPRKELSEASPREEINHDAHQKQRKACHVL
jgi:hypothetical protein